MLGKLLYSIYHKPKNKIYKLYKQNTRSYKATETGKIEMLQAAEKLDEIYNNDVPAFDLHFLTGRNFWYQTIFCLHSLQKVCNDVQINAVLYDDGSLDPKNRDHIARHFPNSRIVSIQTLEENVNQFLPENKFPHIRRTRGHYPHLKKLTDIHAGQTGWRIVADSDMLFFNYPAEVIKWLKKPTNTICLKDITQSYGYPAKVLEEIAGTKLPGLINVGLTGIKSESVDWEKIEYWIKCLSKYNTSYYLEQALTAMLFADTDVQILDPSAYIVLPGDETVRQRKGILHHYVAASKEIYLTTAWKLTL